jgi:hypothetical protein
VVKDYVGAAFLGSASECLFVPCTHHFKPIIPTKDDTSAHAMSESRNTLACFFDPTSPRLTAIETHEWIHSQLKVTEHSVLMIQIDGTRRQVFIKFTEFNFLQDILNTTSGENVYKHATGEISPVRQTIAGMGQRRIRLANLPRELPNIRIRNALTHMVRFNQSKMKPGPNTIDTLSPMGYGLPL